MNNPIVSEVHDSIALSPSPHEHDDKKEFELNYIKGMSRWQKIKIKFFNRASIGIIQFKTWKHAIPLYAIKCPIHGIKLSYPSGWKQVLKCSACYSTVLE